jgi:hypothetical protein
MMTTTTTTTAPFMVPPHGLQPFAVVHPVVDAADFREDAVVVERPLVEDDSADEHPTLGRPGTMTARPTIHRRHATMVRWDIQVERKYRIETSE